MSINSRRQELSKDGGIDIGIRQAPSLDVNRQKCAGQRYRHWRSNQKRSNAACSIDHLMTEDTTSRINNHRDP
jgi:hypothetical protein